MQKRLRLPILNIQAHDIGWESDPQVSESKAPNIRLARESIQEIIMQHFPYNVYQCALTRHMRSPQPASNL